MSHVRLDGAQQEGSGAVLTEDLRDGPYLYRVPHLPEGAGRDQNRGQNGVRTGPELGQNKGRTGADFRVKTSQNKAEVGPDFRVRRRTRAEPVQNKIRTGSEFMFRAGAAQVRSWFRTGQIKSSTCRPGSDQGQASQKMVITGKDLGQNKDRMGP